MSRFGAETIFALSSGAVPAGIAVIRISGIRSRDVLRMLTAEVPPARKLRLAKIGGSGGEPIDHGLVAFFPGPHSFTGEDSVELHLHGSRAIIARVMEVLGSLDGLRLAEAGEFTLRAFRNGKLDLTEAEALSDLIVAETERQRQLALANASGLVREQYAAWRGRIVEAMALLEAVLDFSDEEDAPDALGEDVWQELRGLAGEIESHVSRFRQGQIIRDGYRVAIVGPPNAGKSSLLNVLAGRDVAIVTDEPGTTRDVLEVDLDLGGMLVKLADTAGLRQAEARAEQLGIARTLQAAERADMILLVQDITNPVPVELPDTEAVRLRVGNKIDLLDREVTRQDFDLYLSTTTGEGLDRLLQAIEERAQQAGSLGGSVPFRERHVTLLRECAEALHRACIPDTELEIRAEELRYAAHCIGRITGRVDVEDLLDVIFSRFCIGK